MDNRVLPSHVDEELAKKEGERGGEDRGVCVLESTG